MGALILEMQQYPQLKARVRYSGVDLVVSRLLFRLCYKWMLVDIEDAPNLVILQVPVFIPFGVSLGSSLLLNRALHQRFWHSPRAKVQFDEASIQVTLLPEVSRLCASSFTDDQKPRLGRSKSGTAL
jgi:hypothetical protein